MSRPADQLEQAYKVIESLDEIITNLTRLIQTVRMPTEKNVKLQKLREKLETVKGELNEALLDEFDIKDPEEFKIRFNNAQSMANTYKHNIKQKSLLRPPEKDPSWVDRLYAAVISSVTQTTYETTKKRASTKSVRFNLSTDDDDSTDTDDRDNSSPKPS